MERHTNESDLREQLLPPLHQLEDPLADPPARDDANLIQGDGGLPNNLTQYLDLRNPLPTDRKFREIVSAEENALVDQGRSNEILQQGRATYCIAILVYTTTIAGIDWLNPGIRLGYLLLIPLPLYVPFVVRWLWERQQRARLSTTMVEATIPTGRDYTQ